MGIRSSAILSGCSERRQMSHSGNMATPVVQETRHVDRRAVTVNPDEVRGRL